MMRRIISVVGLAMWLMSCQASATTEVPTVMMSDVTPLATEPAVRELSTPREDSADMGVVPIITTPLDVDAQVAETATPRRLRLVASATSIIRDTNVSVENQIGLQFETVDGVNKDTSCIFVFVTGTSTAEWLMTLDNGIQFASFTRAGNVYLCGLQASQPVTFTIFDANGDIVPGAQSVSTQGGAALYGKWIDGSGSTTADSSDGTRGLRFRLDNSDADQRCVIVTIKGASTGGWIVKGDGLKVSAEFDAVGTAELCGLNRRQEFTFSVYDAKQMTVAGGAGIPARGGDAFVAEWGAVAVVPTATSTPVVDNRALRVSLKNSDDDPRCISMQIRGIRTSGWVLKADGLKPSATFDSAGNARFCGLRRRQEFTFSVFNTNGVAIAGGVGIPARGGNIFVADWR